MHTTTPETETAFSEVIIIGAGFAGMMALHNVRKIGLDALVLEAGSDVGGTWYWNRYPGLTCDIESSFYSYSFDEELQQEWVWKDRYASQADILRYAQHVADRFDLRRSIRFDTRIRQLDFDERTTTWELRDEAGRSYRARFVIAATGVLSAPKEVGIPGLEEFQGEVLQTTDWPRSEPDLSGKRVAVVGTGSSGIQVCTALAGVAGHLFVLQRTPSHSVPNWNRALEEREVAEIKSRYAAIREVCRTTLDGLILPATGKNTAEFTAEEQRRLLDEVWSDGRGFRFDVTFEDTLLDESANAVVADYLGSKIAEIVKDPETAETLTPKGYPFGTRRICMDAGYYGIFNREDVTLVDLLKKPLVRVVADGVMVGDEKIECDALVLATGYDAVTGALGRIDVRGRDGVTLRDAWRDGAETLYGVASAGFPNLLMVCGPQSPSVLTNMIVAIEQHVNWLTGLLGHMSARGLESVEARPEAVAAWSAHSDGLANGTLHRSGSSWFSGANVEGKAKRMLAYIGGIGMFGEALDKEQSDGYPGFSFTGPPVGSDGRGQNERILEQHVA